MTAPMPLDSESVNAMDLPPWSRRMGDAWMVSTSFGRPVTGRTGVSRSVARTMVVESRRNRGTSKCSSARAAGMLPMNMAPGVGGPGGVSSSSAS